MKTIGLFLLKVTLSAWFLWLLLNLFDLTQVKETLQRLHGISLGIALLGYGMSLGCATFRWKLGMIPLLHKKISGKKLFRIVLIGVTLNQGLPSTIGGDLYRVWALKTWNPHPAQNMRLVFLDRLWGMVGLICVVLLGLFLVPQYWNQYPFREIIQILKMVCWIGTGGIFLCLFLRKKLSNLLLNVWLKEGIQGFLLYPARLTVVIILTSFLQIASLYGVAKDLQIDWSFGVFFVIIPTALIISTIPVSLAGWGLREWSFVSITGALGTPVHCVVSFSLVIGFIQVIWAIPGLLWYLQSSLKTFYQNRNAQS
jgi:uncharacterized membrane protein YbhN (UPF0104 family)